jgi:hypothetical protein
MKKIFFLFVLFEVSLNSSGQNISKEYVQLIKKADSLYYSKNYLAAAEEYTLAFNANNDKAKVKHRYFAATCWALSKNLDSAFYQLNKIVTKGKYSDYYQITGDDNFNSLHADKRWKLLIQQITLNAEDERNTIKSQIQPEQK